MNTNYSVKKYEVTQATIQEVRDFVEKWHYSKSVNGLRVSHCFGLYDNSEMIGAMIYGSLGMANAWRKYGEKESDVVELRRLCCIDDTPKNTESYFIGKTIRWLKKNTDYKIIVSYADTHYGHEGVIYRASNFRHSGMTSTGRKIALGEKLYHDKAIRTYYINSRGEKTLKPFAQRLIDAINEGSAKYIETGQKHIYTYPLC